MPADRTSSVGASNAHSSIHSGNGDGDGNKDGNDGNRKNNINSITGKRPYAKVNRSLRACDACHQRKTRCSGQIPCKFCTSRGLQCRMSDDAVRASAQKPGPSRSQERAALHLAIEQRHAQKSISPSMKPVPLSSILGLPYPGYLAPQAGQGTSCPPQASTSGTSYHPPSSSTSTHMNLPLPMPAPAGATSTPAAEFGRSISSSPGKALLALSASQPLSRSELSSSQELRGPNDVHPVPFPDPFRRVSPSSRHSIPVPPLETAEETSTVRNENDYCPEGTIFNRLQRQPHFVREADITVMLTREASNRYLDLYFADAECIYQLWPVPSIIQRCHDTIWGELRDTDSYSPTQQPPGLRSSLTAALAFGALLDHKTTDSEMLYHAARSCYLDLMDTGSIETVQLALQLAVFELNTKRANLARIGVAIAVRTAQALGLHRKSSLIGCSQEEALRRSQLWWSCYLQDSWISIFSSCSLICTSGIVFASDNASQGGNKPPPLIVDADCDLEKDPWSQDARLNKPIPAFISPFFPLAIRLAALWGECHAKLLRYGKDSPGVETKWSENLPLLDMELRLWQRDIHQMYMRMSQALAKSERLHCQAVLLTFSAMRLTIHRTYLRMRISSDHQHQMLQRVMSQNTILDSALDIIAYHKSSIQQGMQISFAFQATTLHLSSLALWEYLQLKASLGLGSDVARAEKGWDSALWLIDHIQQSGRNQSMAETAAAVRAMQKAPRVLKAEAASPPFPSASELYPAPSAAPEHQERDYDQRRQESAALQYTSGSHSSATPYQTPSQPFTPTHHHGSSSMLEQQTPQAPHIHPVYEARPQEHYTSHIQPQASSSSRSGWPSELALEQTFPSASAHYVRMPARDLNRWQQQ